MGSQKKPQGKTILGLDPGTVRIGFALLSCEKKQLLLLDMGVLKAKGRWALEKRLFVLSEALEQIFKKHEVKETAIERVFLGKNPDSAFKLGQAFGLCVYQATRFQSQVLSYPARYVKQAVTGSGRADKEMVKNFVLNQFGLKNQNEESDATDALAVALCHLYQVQLNQKGLKSSPVKKAF